MGKTHAKWSPVATALCCPVLLVLFIGGGGGRERAWGLCMIFVLFPCFLWALGFGFRVGFHQHMRFSAFQEAWPRRVCCAVNGVYVDDANMADLRAARDTKSSLEAEVAELRSRPFATLGHCRRE